MKAVVDVIGVARSNLVERMGGRSRRRVGRPPAPADELVAEIEALLADLPTYGYRRVHAVLRRRALAEGRQPPNHKRVYRVMREHGLLLQPHAGGVRRRHGKLIHRRKKLVLMRRSDAESCRPDAGPALPQFPHLAPAPPAPAARGRCGSRKRAPCQPRYR